MFGRGENVIDRDDISWGLNTTFVHELSGIHAVVVNGTDEVRALDKLLVNGSYYADTSDAAETLSSAASEDGAEAAVKPLGNVLKNQMMPEIGLWGNEATDAHVLDDMDTSDKNGETATRTGLIEGVCDIDEGTQTSIDSVSTFEHSGIVAGVTEAIEDLVSTFEHSGIVAGVTEAIDSKVLSSRRDVKFGDHKFLTTRREEILAENADYRVERALKVAPLPPSQANELLDPMRK